MSWVSVEGKHKLRLKNLRRKSVVIVTRKYNQQLDGTWKDGWTYKMDDFIGKESYVVSMKRAEEGIRLSNRLEVFNFPYGVVMERPIVT